VANQGRCGDARTQGVILAVMFFWLTCLTQFCWAQGGEKVLDLEASYTLALKNHEKIHIAKIEVEKSQLLPKKVMTIMTPRLSATGSYTRLNAPIEFEGQLGNITLPPIQTFPEEQSAGNFEFLQPIYEGEFFPARRQAGQAVELTTESYSQTAQDVMFQVAEAYYGVLKGERLVQNAK
jgi:outer membrane protein TolC